MLTHENQDYLENEADLKESVKKEEYYTDMPTFFRPSLRRQYFFKERILIMDNFVNTIKTPERHEESVNSQ